MHNSVFSLNFAPRKIQETFPNKSNGFIFVICVFIFRCGNSACEGGVIFLFSSTFSSSALRLTSTGASLHDVDYIVAQLLTLVDEIHVHRSNRVGIDVVIDIVDILSLDEIAVVVDLILDVE